VTQRRRCGHGEMSRWRNIFVQPVAAMDRWAPVSGEDEVVHHSPSGAMATTGAGSHLGGTRCGGYRTVQLGSTRT
jgi:hypothetical protein